MIISRTPYRISFFGGGSDYPEWFRENGGEVISTTINKYIYITIRNLPGFFKHRHRIVYSRIETVRDIKNIVHPAVKHMLLLHKPKYGLEMHYDGDLPSKSGMGSSSSFVVGLMNAILKLNKIELSKKKLANKSISFEREILRENVGFQDQIAASYGGFNNIKFYKNNFTVSKIICSKNFLNSMNDNLLILFTGKNRSAQRIAQTYTNILNKTKKNNLKKILKYVDYAKELIKNNNADDFGRLLHETWLEKKKISTKITSNRIDEIYNFGIKNGALGGKLLGAGGGGFLLFYVKKEKKNFFLKKLNNFKIIPVRFENEGSKIIYED